MTTRTLTGTYPAGYTLKVSYSALTLTTTALVGGIGIIANASATVTNSGAVTAAAAPAGTAQYAGILLSAGGEVVNLGAVAGGQGSIGVASSGYDGEPGGEGVDIASGSITNHESITGGQGGAAGKTGGYGGSGGNGVYLSGVGSVTNVAGTISGGAGGSGVLSEGGAGLLSLSYAQLDNGSVIVGGAPGIGHGSCGIEFLSGASVNNTGTILGGAGSGVYRGGAGAFLVQRGTIDNSGEIMGGAGGVISPGGGVSSAPGVLMYGQWTITNTGTVAGGVGALGAGIFLAPDGPDLSGGTVTNGDAGHTNGLITGYDGVEITVNAATVDNFATIEATGGKGAYGLAMHDGGSVTNYTKGLISGYGGVDLNGSLGNDGTIKGTGAAAGYGVLLASGNIGVNGSDTYKTALIEGWTGVLVSGFSTLTNYGTIEGGASDIAVVLTASTATLVAETDSVFKGKVLGGGGTLVLSGAGTIGGLAGGDVTVSASMPTTTFDDFDTVDIASGAKFALAGNGSLASVDSLADEGVLSVSGTLSIAGGLSTTGTLSGAGTLAVTAGGVVDLDGGTALTIAKVTQSGATNEATIGASSLGFAGLWDQTGGTLSVGAADKIVFSGTDNSFAGTLAGAGTIDFDGGVDTLSGATLTATSAIISGASVALVGTITLTDTLVATTPKIVIGAAGANLSGGGRLELTNASTNLVLGVSSAATLTNGVVIFGAGDLGDGQMTLDNAAKGAIEGDDSVALTINTGAKTIVNAGDLTAVTALTIDSPLDNTGVLYAVGGTLRAQGAVTGAGHAEVEGAGTLILKGAFNENVTFATGSTGTLELGDSKGYTTGAITGFSKTGANLLDLLDIPFVSGTTTATYTGTTTSGVLTVKDGANVANIHLTGDYLGSSFIVSASSAGGTKVVDPASAPAPLHVAAPISPHPFIAAMAGFGAREAAAGALEGVHWNTPPPMLAASRALA
jgi:hypothetical protein